MGRFDGPLTGTVTFVFAVMIMMVSWYIVPEMIGFLPNTLLQGLFWAGYIVLLLMLVVIWPLMSSMKTTEE